MPRKCSCDDPECELQEWADEIHEVLHSITSCLDHSELMECKEAGQKLFPKLSDFLAKAKVTHATGVMTMLVELHIAYIELIRTREIAIKDYVESRPCH